MKIRQNFDNGYSEMNVQKVVGEVGEVICVTTNPIPVFGTENGKTDFSQVTAFKLWFGSKNLEEPLLVKFPPDVGFPGFGQKCKLKTLEACIVKDNCYFRAEDIILRDVVS